MAGEQVKRLRDIALKGDPLLTREMLIVTDSQFISLLSLSLFLFLFFGHTCGIWKFLGQGRIQAVAVTYTTAAAAALDL